MGLNNQIYWSMETPNIAKIYPSGERPIKWPYKSQYFGHLETKYMDYIDHLEAKYSHLESHLVGIYNI